MSDPKAKWMRLLRIAGALSVALGVYELVADSFIFFVWSALSQDVASDIGETLETSVVYVMCALVFIAFHGVVEIASGVAAFLVKSKRVKPSTCELLGVILIGLAVVSTILSSLMSYFGTRTVVTMLLCLIVPVFYCISARRLTSSKFWEGIKQAESEGESLADEKSVPTQDEIEDAPRSYVLDAYVKDARSSPSCDSRPTVSIVSLENAQAMGNERLCAMLGTQGALEHCRAEAFASCIVGTLSIPQEALVDWGFKVSGQQVSAAFVVDTDRLVFASDDDCFCLLFKSYAGVQAFEKTTPLAVLAEFIEFIIQDDLALLIDQQERLDKLEENMVEDVNEIPRDFDEYVVSVRKMQRTLLRFYRQLADVAQTIVMTPHYKTDAEEHALFTALENRISRLAQTASELFDYALQIKNLYQAKIDVRQGKVMLVLTIVTTIFMPLTLVTGWYGMNFANMPELSWPFSYFIVIALAVFMVTAEVVVFKKKKWF